jgi:hypothetical protein
VELEVFGDTELEQSCKTRSGAVPNRPLVPQVCGSSYAFLEESSCFIVKYLPNTSTPVPIDASATMKHATFSPILE